MSQQVKDVYSGMKKIFPGSHRRHTSRRRAATGLEADLAADAPAVAWDKPTKRTSRHASFSFAGWKDKHRTSSEPTPVVMSLPYGATAATPRAHKASDEGLRPSLTKTLTNVFHASPLFPSTHRSNTRAQAHCSSTNEASRPQAAVRPKLGGRSLSECSPSLSNPTRHHRTVPAPRLTKAHATTSACGSPSAPVQDPLYSPVQPDHKARGRKPRGLSLSFSSAWPQTSAPAAPTPPRGCAPDAQKAFQGARTWKYPRRHADGDDATRPTRLDRRSQSMDFMEQAPTHLIAKLWRKLPLHARLIGGHGPIDLDLQKDRTSFSRRSEARKLELAAEKATAALHRSSSCHQKVPSPLAIVAFSGAKRVRFRVAPTVVVANANDGPAAYTVLESYDEVLVRVCQFARHDHRPTSVKVHDFLDRSLAFLHGRCTKQGHGVTISNEEIRMWRRLARHDWRLEHVTTVQAAAALRGIPSSRPLEGTERDRASPLRSTTETEPEKEQEGDLDVPSSVKLADLWTVVNCCVSFGPVLYTLREIQELVRLKFLVEEDGWI